MQNQISLLCSGSTQLPFRLRTAITRYGEDRLCLQQVRDDFFFLLVFLSPFFFSFSLSRLDKFTEITNHAGESISTLLKLSFFFFFFFFFFFDYRVLTKSFVVFLWWGGGGGAGGRGIIL